MYIYKEKHRYIFVVYGFPIGVIFFIFFRKIATKGENKMTSSYLSLLSPLINKFILMLSFIVQPVLLQQPLFKDK